MKLLRFSLPVLITLVMAVPGSRAGAQQESVVRRTETGASVSYSVTPNMTAETFRVTGMLNNISGDTITYYFPIWGPGAYDIVNFGAYVTDFKATSSKGRPLTVLRGDTNTFRIIGGDSKINISYTVHDIESAPSSLWFGLSDIEKDFAFANTPAIFGYPAGYKDIPYMVNYEVPKGWDIAIGLDPAPGRGSFKARDYDELVDAPLTMGKFQRLEFTAGGKPHIIAIFAPKKLYARQSQELVSETRKIVEVISRFFGEMPYDRYIFQHYLVEPQMGDAVFGALEHRNSSTYRMPYIESMSVAEGLRSVIAHEYWHLWSPKRIHVRELGPFDYQRAPHTNSLWFAEGLTEYYAQALLARAGISSRRDVLGFVGQNVAAFHGKPQSRSIAELSMIISEVSPEQTMGLYTKGPIVGLLLDAAIRTQTNNRKSLDDAMRYLNDQYGKTGRNFGDDEIIPAMERATGAKLADFYQRYIVGREPLPFDEYLPKIGFKLVTEYKERRTLGAELEQAENGWRINAILPGGSADSMGMKVGDVITEIRFKRNAMSTATLPLSYAPTLATMADVAMFGVMRDGAPIDVKAKLLIAKVPSVHAQIDPEPSPAAAAMRKDIFGF